MSVIDWGRLADQAAPATGQIPATVDSPSDADLLGPIPVLSHRDCAAGVTDL